MKILVINCGSSSLKYQLIDIEIKKALAVGICERIGLEGSKIKYSPAGGEKVIKESPMPTHDEAINLVLESLLDKEVGVIGSLDEIGAIGHRVVHGGENFSSSTIINDEVMKAIEESNSFAPLHNPANLIGINACKKIMPNVKMVAVFDTAFHQTMPPKAYLYGLPYEYYEKYGVRRYGFHGTSHDYVSKRAYDFVGLDQNDSKVIVCHLGNGASISAVLNGKSIDTSMGMTPLEGLVMGTRSGDIDPAIIEYMMNVEDKTIHEVQDILNKESGVYGLSGISSDFRDLEDACNAGNERAIMALDVYCYQVAKYIGSYTAAMNGVDAIIFTAGVGENDHAVRKGTCSYLGYLGVTLNEEENMLRGGERFISTEDSKVKVCVIATNEELAIARETFALIK